MADLGVGRRDAVATVLGFNIGVELGQLVIVAALYPLARLAGRRWQARRLVQGVFIAILAVACFWLVERSLAI